MNEYATDPNFYPHTQVCKNNHFLYFSITGLSCSSPDWQCKIQLHVSMAGSSITAEVWGPYIVSRCWRVGNTSSQSSFHVNTHRNMPSGCLWVIRPPPPGFSGFSGPLALSLLLLGHHSAAPKLYWNSEYLNVHFTYTAQLFHFWSPVTYPGLYLGKG